MPARSFAYLFTHFYCFDYCENIVKTFKLEILFFLKLIYLPIDDIEKVLWNGHFRLMFHLVLRIINSQIIQLFYPLVKRKHCRHYKSNWNLHILPWLDFGVKNKTRNSIRTLLRKIGLFQLFYKKIGVNENINYWSFDLELKIFEKSQNIPVKLRFNKTDIWVHRRQILLQYFSCFRTFSQFGRVQHWFQVNLNWVFELVQIHLLFLHDAWEKFVLLQV